MEEIQVPDGRVRNPSFTDYLIPTILDMPPMKLEILEYPDPHAPYGLRGAGEPPTLSSTPAIAAAVRAATGLPLPRVPIRPEHITAPRSLATPPRSCGALRTRCLAGGDALGGGEGRGAEEDQPGLGHPGVRAAQGGQGLAYGVLQRPPVRPGGDQREGDRRRAQLVGDRERVRVAGPQQVGLINTGFVDRADGVDHPLGRQTTGRGGHRLAGGQAVAVAIGPQPAALRQDLRPALGMDGAIDPTPTEQRRVGGVDDRVDLLRR